MKPKKIEILAPVGNREMLKAAIENGADSVYFGVQAFNARMRAHNFEANELGEIMSGLHERGLKGYLTLNVLIFEDELEEAASLLLTCSRAGVDAVIVQDAGLAWLARRLAPDLPIHASTQMTVSSAESIAGLSMLGIDFKRVVLARELNTGELRKISAETDVELEVFIHGALCVAYSGQCLTSEALGGRSANRGECAQACRLPYDLLVDGEERDVGNLRYLVSPKDLAGFEQVPDLMELGISSLKIEGRLKSPEYVAASIQAYREARESAIAGKLPLLNRESVERMESTFSRGFTAGYLKSNDHQAVVEGDYSSKRGPLAGVFLSASGKELCVRNDIPLKAGDGVVFDCGGGEQGGRIFSLRPGKKRGELILDFSRSEIDLSRLKTGARFWKTSDPEIEKTLRKSFQGEEIRYRVPIGVRVRARLGEPISVSFTDESGRSVSVTDQFPAEASRDEAMNEALLRDQLGRLGGTPFFMTSLDLDVPRNLFVPKSRLNNLRREAVLQLTELRRLPTERSEQTSILGTVREKIRQSAERVQDSKQEPSLSVLCRTLEQVEAAYDARVQTIYTDFEDQRLNKDARKLIQSSDVRFAPATIRILKPGEDGMLRKIVSAEPDAILIRNLASWKVLCEAGMPVEYIGDYSLNVSNSITASLLMEAGFLRLTPSYDLNFEQLEKLLHAAPKPWFEVTIHQHIPMFHMEHCVFCRFLSTGNNSTNCGRPCEKHEVRLKDRMGFEHPLKADYGCRNTLYNAVPQSASEYIPGLLSSGTRSFRVDLLLESGAETERLIQLYRSVLSGDGAPGSVWRALRANSKLGVTRGGLDHTEATHGQKLYTFSRRPGPVRSPD